MTNKNENYDDSFENIEKTVEDLKKKLQKLEEEEVESVMEETPKEDSFVDELKQSTKDLKEEAISQVEDLGEKIEDHDQTQKVLSYVKEHARKSQQRLSNDQKEVQSCERWKNLSLKVKEGKEQFEKTILPKVQEGVQLAVDKTKEFIQSDFVQDGIAKAKETGEMIWHKVQDKMNEKK